MQLHVRREMYFIRGIFFSRRLHHLFRGSILQMFVNMFLSNSNNIYTCINLSPLPGRRRVARAGGGTAGFETDTSIWEFYVCANKVLFYYFDLRAMWRWRGSVCCQWHSHVCSIEFICVTLSHTFSPRYFSCNTRTWPDRNKTCCRTNSNLSNLCPTVYWILMFFLASRNN